MTETIPENDGTGRKWKEYAAGGPRDLVADGGGLCRKIVLLEAGTLTLCEDINGVDEPLNAVSYPAFYEHTAACKRVSSSGAILVYW